MYEKIKALMQERGVKQVQISKETGISKQSFHQWKQGKVKPSARSLRRLAGYFGVSVDFLLGTE